VISLRGSTICALGSLLCLLCPPLSLLGDAKPGLDFSVSDHGLGSLSFNGQLLLASPHGGELQSAQSLFRNVTDAVLDKSSSPATRSQTKDAVDLAYPWGSVSCAYSKKGENEIVLHIGITNSSKGAISDVSLRLMELNFPSVPEGMTLEAGMFGFGFKGKPAQMGAVALLADPEFVVPIVRVDYGNSTLNLCSDDVESLVGVLYPTNRPANTSYPFLSACQCRTRHHQNIRCLVTLRAVCFQRARSFGRRPETLCR